MSFLAKRSISQGDCPPSLRRLDPSAAAQDDIATSQRIGEKTRSFTLFQDDSTRGPGDALTALARLLFEREAVFSLGVALFAAWHDVAFRRFTAADDRNEVIHREFARRKLAAAMVADPCRAPAFPPLAQSQLSCLPPFAPNFLFGYFY